MVERKLKRLNNRQFYSDVKQYITSSHDFLGMKVPELRTLAKRLHKEHQLKDFYKTFNKLWNSSYHEESTLAIYTLELYKKDFDIETWKFLKPKLKNMKSLDQIDSVGYEIVGELLIKFKSLKTEIFEFARARNVWLNRLAMVATTRLVKTGDIAMAMRIAEGYSKEKHPYIQKSLGRMLREVGKVKPDVLEKYIQKNIKNLPPITFDYATEYMEDLRKLRTPQKKAGVFSRMFLGGI